MEPTEEQIKRFWEWCGFRHITAKYCKLCKRWEGEYWLKERIGRRIYRPELLVLDLNNLFKYAVPKIESLDIVGLYPSNENNKLWSCILTRFGLDKDTVAYGKDPALALFWAINKVIEDATK